MLGNCCVAALTGCAQEGLERTLTGKCKTRWAVWQKAGTDLVLRQRQARAVLICVLMRPWPGQLEFRPKGTEGLVFLSDSFHDALQPVKLPLPLPVTQARSGCQHAASSAMSQPSLTSRRRPSNTTPRVRWRHNVTYVSTAQYDVFRIRITPMDSFPLMPGQGPEIELPAE